MGTNDEPKMVQMGNTLTSSERDALAALLKELKEVFAWTYEGMPGIDIYIYIYIYSATLHSNRSSHEANQAEAKEDEAKVDS